MTAIPAPTTLARRLVCVYGFWGIRHQLEELLADPARRRIPDEVPVGNPGALVALGVKDDATKTLERRLSPILTPGAVRTLTTKDKLLDSLFGADRPGIVLVLGHLQTEPRFGQPDGSRILLFTADGWLQGKAITDRNLEFGSWESPNSVVLLLSCKSVIAGLLHFRLKDDFPFFVFNAFGFFWVTTAAVQYRRRDGLPEDSPHLAGHLGADVGNPQRGVRGGLAVHQQDLPAGVLVPGAGSGAPGGRDLGRERRQCPGRCRVAAAVLPTSNLGAVGTVPQRRNGRAQVRTGSANPPGGPPLRSLAADLTRDRSQMSRGIVRRWRAGRARNSHRAGEVLARVAQLDS